MDWRQLWQIAATITPTDEPSEVELTWPDGSRAGLYWHYSAGRWCWAECLDLAPCDVAARDSL